MIYRLRYCNKDGVEARVDIQKGSSTPVIDVEGTGKPFILSYQNDKPDKRGAIRSSSADIEIYETTDFNIDNLKTSNETELAVTYYINNIVKWKGFIIPDFFSIEVRSNPVIVMTASDRLGTLKNVTLSDLPTIVNIRELAVSCLNKTGLTLPLKTMADFSNDDTDNAFFSYYVDSQRIKDIKGRSISCYDILSSILIASNSKLVQRAGEWVIINKLQHEIGSGKIYSSLSSFTNYLENIYNFDEVSIGARRTITPVAGSIGIYHEHGGRKSHPENYDFSLDLSGWNSVNGFVATIENRHIIGFLGGTPLFDAERTVKQYLLNYNNWIDNTNNLNTAPYISTDAIPINSPRADRVEVTVDISSTMAEKLSSNTAISFLRYAVILTNGVKTYTLTKAGIFEILDPENISGHSLLLRGGQQTPLLLASPSFSNSDSFKGLFEVGEDDNVNNYSATIRVYGSGDQYVTVNYALIKFSDASELPKGTMYKTEQGNVFTKAYDIETSIFGDYLLSGLDGYFYRYPNDDTSSIYKDVNTLSSPIWTTPSIPNETSELPLLHHSMRQMRRMFSVAHDLLSAEIEASNFDPLAIFVACEKRYTVVSAQFDFFKSNLSVELEEVAFQSATVRDFIYSYFGDGESGIKSIGGISGGGGSTGGGLTPEQIEILSFWKKDPDNPNTIFTEMNAYSKLELSAYGASDGGGGGSSDYERLDTWVDYDSTKSGWVLSALLGNELNTRVGNLEGGSALTVNTTGAGNAITSISKAGTVITANKGLTFALASHTHTSLYVPDTRAIVSVPENLQARVLQLDFKNNTSVGNPPTAASPTYSHIISFAGWNAAEGSGGWPSQMSIGDGIAVRQAVNATTWGTWRNVYHTGNLLLVTTSANGLMSATDKSKLDGIAAGAKTGTVTSVAMTVPTGLSISGSPITTSGTLAVSLASGYSIPTTAKQTQWDTAYTHSQASHDYLQLSGGTLTGNLTAPTFIGSLTGNADTSTKLQTARTIAGVSFDGTANIAIPFANLSSKPTTITGYGITDAYTKTEVNSALTLKLDKSVFDDLFEKVEVSAGVFAIKAKYNFYGVGEISAYGLGTGGSGGGSYDRLDTWASYDSTKSGWVLSALLGNELNTRVGNLEGGSALTINTTGTGNAITSISKAGTVITADKGLTFSLGNHLHTGIYEPVFSKNTAFNKNFGTAAGTVAEGNHTHSYLPLSGGTLTGNINITPIEGTLGVRTHRSGGSAYMWPYGNSLSSIRTGLGFGWYDTEWIIGNIRGGATDSYGFGIGYKNASGNLDGEFRIASGGAAYLNNVQIATISSNVASATKLQTSRTIWGQSFDGSGNVGGNLSNVADINLTGSLSSPNVIGILNGAYAQGMNLGSLLVSSAYSDRSNVPVNGIWAAGEIRTATKLVSNSGISQVMDLLLSGSSNVAAETASSGISFMGYGVAHANMAFVPSSRTFVFATNGNPRGLTDTYGAINVSLSGKLSAGNISTTGISMSGALSGVTTLAMTGALTGATTISASSTITATGNLLTSANLIANTGVTIAQTGGTGIGLSLYNSAGLDNSTNPAFGIMFAATVNKGTHGAVTGDWATYFTMSTNTGRGWIFTTDPAGTTGNIVSISNTGNITASGEITAYVASDRRLKHNITPLFSSLDIIDKLNPVSYYWNAKAKELNPMKSDSLDYGLIAQEVENVLPDVVHGIFDDKYKSIDYIKLIPIMIAAIKELKKEINNLKN